MDQMQNTMFIGMDVHKATISVAIANEDPVNPNRDHGVSWVGCNA